MGKLWVGCQLLDFTATCAVDKIRDSGKESDRNVVMVGSAVSGSPMVDVYYAVCHRICLEIATVNSCNGYLNLCTVLTAVLLSTTA